MIASCVTAIKTLCSSTSTSQSASLPILLVFAYHTIPYHTIPYHTIPYLQEELGMEKATTPMQCRLRNLNYAAPIVADIEYTRGNDRVKLLNQVIGRMPIMLHSNKYDWVWQVGYYINP